jgi:hypothetical protein
MRYRFARPADLTVLRSLLNRVFKPSARVSTNLIALWRAMVASGALRITLVEDAALPDIDAIQMIGASVFLTNAFFDNYLQQPYPGLSAQLYEEMLAGNSPVLTGNEIREANSREGLNLLMMHFALKNPDLNDRKTQEVMFAVNTAFFFFYGGYHLKTAMQEVYGRQAADYMHAGGFRIVDDFGASFAGANEGAADLQPYLLLLRREEVQPSAVNPLSFLFYPMRPLIHFSPGEQKVLELALLNESDKEIADDLGISADAVKKTWRRAYERASLAAPHLTVADGEGKSMGARGAEKRRHLLDYLRIHLEELRPHEASA